MGYADEMIKETVDRKSEIGNRKSQKDLRFSNYDFRFPKLSTNRGQSMVEFTFAMMVTLILIYALFMVFRWAGMDLAERRFAHEKLLTTNTVDPATRQQFRAEQQLNPDFFKPRKIDAAFRGFELK